MAAPVPMMAQIVGMISKYLDSLLLVSIKKPKVKIEEGQGNPREMVFSNEASGK